MAVALISLRSQAVELGFSIHFGNSREFQLTWQKLDRLIDLIAQRGAKRYISGPAAKSYVDADPFEALGIELIWKDYSNYPEYAQNHPPFEHGVTILDLLFHTGPDAPWYIWGWREHKVPPWSMPGLKFK